MAVMKEDTDRVPNSPTIACGYVMLAEILPAIGRNRGVEQESSSSEADLAYSTCWICQYPHFSIGRMEQESVSISRRCSACFSL